LSGTSIREHMQGIASQMTDLRCVMRIYGGGGGGFGGASFLVFFGVVWFWCGGLGGGGGGGLGWILIHVSCTLLTKTPPVTRIT